MSFHVDTGPFKVNQAGKLDRDWFHSIDDKAQTEVSVNQSKKVKHVFGIVLSSYRAVS